MTVLCHGVSGFDSLQCAIRKLRQREPVERGAMLSEIIKPLFAIRYSEHFEGDGAVFFGGGCAAWG